MGSLIVMPDRPGEKCDTVTMELSDTAEGRFDVQKFEDKRLP